MNIRNKGLEQEFQFQTSRSGGKGGQNVNKVETKVEILFNVPSSTLLSEDEKRRISKKLSNKINSEGTLILYSQKSRSQAVNKADVVKKFFDIVEKTLVIPVVRKPIRISSAAKAQRLSQKRKLSERKAERKFKRE
jgi:ribosome-associated protein